MKPVLVAWFLLAVCACAPACAATLSSYRIHDRTYVSLADWAKTYSFKLARKDKEVRITSRWSTLVFTTDSRRAELNGVVVWLSFPIAFRDSQAFIAPLDLEKVIHPVLFPPKNESKRRVTTVCLDAGHGGRDPGNQDGKNQEKEYTLALAKELQTQLKDAGFKVVMTRSADRFVDLGLRATMADNYDADLFISIHFNSASSSASGTEVFCLTPPGASSTSDGSDSTAAVMYPGNRNDSKNMLLAFYIEKSLGSVLKVEDRGVRRARFVVLKYARMPAILLEGGFMSDPAEAKKIYSTSYRRQMAKAVVEGVQAYKRLVER